MSKRVLKYPVLFDGRIDDNLKAQGISGGVIAQLRKEWGAVKITEGAATEAVRLCDYARKGATVTIALCDTPPHVPVCDVAIDIVYQDDDLAVIDKPAGLACIPVHGHYGRSLANALANVWGDFVYRPVNRLDRDTSGLMIVAKHRLAHAVLCDTPIVKKYLGLCDGNLPKEGLIDAPIALERPEGMKRCVRADGKPARTGYRIIDVICGRYTLAEFELLTGRTHQIRVHTAYLGAPLCCDRLYHPAPQPIALPDGAMLDRQALHSAYLSFRHPVCGKVMRFQSVPQCSCRARLIDFFENTTNR